MPDTKPPLIQVASMALFVQAVERAGVSAAELGETVGITVEMLGDPQAFAPAQAIYRFTELAATELGEPNLGVKLGLDPEVTKWPVVASSFANSKVMVEFFTRFLLDTHRFSTNVDFNLNLGSRRSWFERDRGFTPRVVPAQLDALGVGLFVNLFRSALGNDWQSSEMLFKVCDPQAARIAEIGSCGLAKGDSRTFAFSFPSNWLMNNIHRRGRPQSPRNVSKPPTEALISSIRSNVRSNLSDPEFGIPKLVAQMGFDRRTVQKYLRERGSGLSEIVEEERKAVACELLKHDDNTLGEVAQVLGYTDVSNFSRAFRRWTGIAPSLWREKQK